jgi:hypothetical protein
MRIDDLDDRMRGFESALDPCVLPGVYMVARLDGRKYSIAVLRRFPRWNTLLITFAGAVKMPTATP